MDEISYLVSLKLYNNRARSSSHCIVWLLDMKAEHFDKGRLTGNTSVPSYNSVIQEISTEEDWDTGLFKLIYL